MVIDMQQGEQVTTEARRIIDKILNGEELADEEKFTVDEED